MMFGKSRSVVVVGKGLKSNSNSTSSRQTETPSTLTSRRIHPQSIPTRDSLLDLEENANIIEELPEV
eukprot:CAMPEP_0173139642 /NCGR_PEP_ID=MMETSP1105-20130129/4384_1 /TAXON_ID=2985 /ORGANISM="Ochromonas sp., Strain BG-1" /LENGTH=66 /DNA_ID=CAMNT_0014052421 /DNA_START=920 /DNA_END=1120 /DNA_ORIENTATION=+